MTLAIQSRRVVTPQGVRPASVHVDDGVITRVGAWGEASIDYGDLAVMPGVVDSHVHINEPGRTGWEGFETALAAAAAGGVTTLIDMPLNAIPATTSVEGLHAKTAAARGNRRVGYWGGVVPGNTAALRPLLEAGVLGFKCFLAPSGVPEFECVTEAHLREAMPVLANLGAVLLAHAESPAFLRAPSGDPRSYASYLASRPREAENEAIALLISLCREFGTRVHVVHLSSSDALPMIRAARAEGLPLTVETCPHYLHFAAGDIPDGATQFKCAPPIREYENREALWEGLADGAIDLIASDHSPCPPAMKAGDFFQAWGGIASLELSLPVVWTEARRRGHGIPDVVRWMCAAPARLAGLSRKGAIQAGSDADLVLFDPDACFQVDGARLHHRHKLTPYEGETLYGAVKPMRREAEFLACCGSRAWAQRMTAAQPFEDPGAMLRAAEEIWWSLRPADWLEAFAAHPRIGEGGGAPWSVQEQSGVEDGARAGLAEMNRAYEARFGYIYLVCATGRSGAEMIELARRRMMNDAPTELRIAATEQARIAALRLRKLVGA